MTGYGQGQRDVGDLRVTVELKTVNNRFADVRFRLPAELAVWESKVRRKVLAHVKRGRVELSVRLERAGATAGAPTLNRELVEAALAGARQLREEYGIEGDVDLARILALPGLFRSEGPLYDVDEELLGVLGKCLDAGLDALGADRAREGKALATEMIERLGTMQRLAETMEEQAAAMPGTVLDRLTARLNALGGEVSLDPARIAQEAALLADRCDVTEEMVRLRGHLAQARAVLEKPDGQPVGKRLDFLLQEIHRETNTVSSKSSDLELTRSALSMKAEGEKVREQVQNLE
jgi:uncharacterized protein (TIGR00255 family)